MANIYRSFVPAGFYHVYNRGVHRESVFLDDFDYQYFLCLLSDRAEILNVSIVAFCIMRNHYHLLLRLGSDESGICKLLSRVAMSYAHYFNAKYSQVGRLFQGPYQSKYVETDEYLLHLTHYIHRNPEEFCDPYSYRWSSIQEYVHRRKVFADPTYVLGILGRRQYALDVTQSEEVTLRSQPKVALSV